MDTTSEDLEDTGGEEGRGKGTCDQAKGLMYVADMFILTKLIIKVFSFYYYSRGCFEIPYGKQTQASGWGAEGEELKGCRGG